jgi:type IX secretion system PorP/SprF family membrane protein
MKTYKNKIVAVVFSLGCLAVNAQQAPMFTHYMYNTLSINPAYAGSRDALTVTALHRSQWMDFKGAPTTQTLTLHSPIGGESVGLGLTVSNDKIGPTNNTAVFADFAYRLKLNEKSKLAFGVSAGANIFQAGLSTLALDNQNDASFQTNISNRTTPNFGFGLYYSRERFYAGVSAPNLLENKYSKNNLPNGNTLAGNEQRHYFLIAGAIFKLSKNLDFKPTTLVKVTSAAPIQADVTASFIIMKKLLLGVMFRTDDSFGALVGVDIIDQLHVGYSYDFSYGLKTARYNQGSHEIMLRYDFIYSSKKQIHSPRYF